MPGGSYQHSVDWPWDFGLMILIGWGSTALLGLPAFVLAITYTTRRTFAQVLSGITFFAGVVTFVIACFSGDSREAAILYLPPLVTGVVALAILGPRERPDRNHVCSGCGYDLRGNKSGNCPECGLAMCGRSGVEQDE